MMELHSQQQLLRKTQRTQEKTYYMFKTGHYSNECPDADDNKPTKNKKGSSFLVLNRDQDSSEDEADLATNIYWQYRKIERR